MSNDLISRSEVLEKLNQNKIPYNADINYLITHAPAAYDVEVWKDIEGYEGKYQVSNYGRIKSLARYRKNNGGSITFQKERILKQSINNKGYSIVELCSDSIGKRYCVHRLVANAFIPNADCKEQINHKDENKQNNYVGNLEWCTCKENINYGSHNTKMSKTKGMPVVCSDDNGIVAEFYSISEAGRTTGISQQNISRCLRGKPQKAGGYYWRKQQDL